MTDMAPPNRPQSHDAASDHGPVHRICGKPVQWLYMRWWCPACQRTVMPGSLKEAERA